MTWSGPGAQGVTAGGPTLCPIGEQRQWEGSPRGREELDQNLGLLWAGGAGKAHLYGHGPPGKPAGSGGHAG